MLEERPGHYEWNPPEIHTEEWYDDPHPWLAEMRAQGPVRYDADNDRLDVFGYHEVSEVLIDEEGFSNELTGFLGGSLMDADPPEHTGLRDMMAAPFRPSALAEKRPRFEDLADEILDDAFAGDDTVEFVEDIAVPMPILIIAEIMGVPQDEMRTFREWTRDMLHVSDAAFVAAENLRDFFGTELEKRETDPQDDLLTEMVRAEQASDLIDRENTTANCVMLLVAGNITTTSFMSNAIWTYLEEGLVPALRSGEIDLSTANDEVLRYRSPVSQVRRVATEPTTVGGVDIDAGTKVVNYLNSAHRDAAAFDAPDEFRPHRDPRNDPIPFGRGIHYCLGAPLAKMEAEIVLERFLSRIDDAELIEDQITPFESLAVYGPERLPIRVAT